MTWQPTQIDVVAEGVQDEAANVHWKRKEIPNVPRISAGVLPIKSKGRVWGNEKDGSYDPQDIWKHRWFTIYVERWDRLKTKGDAGRAERTKRHQRRRRAAELYLTCRQTTGKVEGMQRSMNPPNQQKNVRKGAEQDAEKKSPESKENVSPDHRHHPARSDEQQLR